MITESEIKGKYLVYKSKNCFILGKIYKIYTLNSIYGKKQQVSLFKGRKIIPGSIVSKSELVVDIEGIEKHAKNNDGVLEFLPEINLEEDFEEKLFVSILASDKNEPVGFEYLVALYVLEEEHRFNNEVIMLSKKFIEQYNRRHDKTTKTYWREEYGSLYAP